MMNTQHSAVPFLVCAHVALEGHHHQQGVWNGLV